MDVPGFTQGARMWLPFPARWLSLGGIRTIDTMEPIATYSEVRFEGSRTFTLLPDKISIRGKQSLTSEFETTIPLASLVPPPDRLWLRNSSFTAGLWLTVISFVASSVLISAFRMSFATFAPGLLVCIGLGGVILMLATFRKVEFVRFKNDGGIVILDIARAGKNAAQLDSFIDALTKQISLTRAGANIPKA